MEETEDTPRRDRGNRRAALWATVVAVPVTVAVAAFTLAKLAPESPDATPSASASPRAQSSAPVELPAPALAERPAVLCRALVSQLPDSVRDLRQRPVTAGPEQNAAYGDPALTVACGGSAPLVPPTDEVFRVNGVCWHPVQEADATVLTTVDREVPVRVRAPTAYQPALQWVVQISDAVVSALPSAKTAPSGCSG
ncbi:DUF3515 family protein [Micromonospora robiginosa]|uniref:DUF3515 family protein n=1 Tax=Micromonospora robiginosa TaxID=2749844 RepID=A0A7L6BDL9_9ACTN|nr:DUF3515 family protein [Micromonospora ferruginea]QLQ39750.1 DUF3515 family protein [Micromonospora ferruginea]